ncbi:hypothetical protein MBLNU459_g0297t1 [Dothideomycetes sp. NU459]
MAQRTYLQSFWAVLFFVFAHVLPPTSASCMTFVPAAGMSSEITRLSSQSFVISAAVTCDAHEPCTIHSGGYAAVESSLNISTSQHDEIYTMIRRITGLDVGDAVTGRIRNETSVFEPANTTVTRYMGFTPFVVCTEGTLSGCSDDSGVANGTAVLACALANDVARDSDGFPLLTGAMHDVVTDLQTAANLTCNPANTTDPYEAPGKCDGTMAVPTTTQPAPAATSSSAATVRKADSALAVLLGVGGVVALL